MKKLLLGTCLLVGAASVSAQNIQLLDENGNTVNSGNVTQAWGGHMDSDIAAHVYVKNTTNAAMDIKVKRYEVSVSSGTENYFCWFSCYGQMMAGVNPLFPAPGSPEDGPLHKRTVAAGDTDSTLSAHHIPNGNNGTECYMYVVYDANNVNDSAYVEVCFNVGFTSIEDNEPLQANHYPNPANDQLNVVLEGLNGRQAQLDVYNMVGEKVATQSISSSRTIVNTSSFGSGVYFYSIKSRNEILVTRKFVVR